MPWRTVSNVERAKPLELVVAQQQRMLSDLYGAFAQMRFDHDRLEHELEAMRTCLSRSDLLCPGEVRAQVRRQHRCASLARLLGTPKAAMVLARLAGMDALCRIGTTSICFAGLAHEAVAQGRLGQRKEEPELEADMGSISERERTRMMLERLQSHPPEAWWTACARVSDEAETEEEGRAAQPSFRASSLPASPDAPTGQGERLVSFNMNPDISTFEAYLPLPDTSPFSSADNDNEEEDEDEDDECSDMPALKRSDVPGLECSDVPGLECSDVPPLKPGDLPELECSDDMPPLRLAYDCDDEDADCSDMPALHFNSSQDCEDEEIQEEEEQEEELEEMEEVGGRVLHYNIADGGSPRHGGPAAFVESGAVHEDLRPSPPPPPSDVDYESADSGRHSRASTRPARIADRPPVPKYPQYDSDIACSVPESLAEERTPRNCTPRSCSRATPENSDACSSGDDDSMPEIGGCGGGADAAARELNAPSLRERADEALPYRAQQAWAAEEEMAESEAEEVAEDDDEVEDNADEEDVDPTSDHSHYEDSSRSESCEEGSCASYSDEDGEPLEEVAATDSGLGALMHRNHSLDVDHPVLERQVMAAAAATSTMSWSWVREAGMRRTWTDSMRSPEQNHADGFRALRLNMGNPTKQRGSSRSRPAEPRSVPLAMPAPWLLRSHAMAVSHLHPQLDRRGLRRGAGDLRAGGRA